ncbi:MAG TPA: TolC family protein [Gemmatimonadaceae bacterium]
MILPRWILRFPLTRLAALLCATAILGCVRFHSKPIDPAASLSALDSRTLADTSLANFLRANHASPTWPPEHWDLRALTLVAFYYHPDLDIARSNWAAARAAVRSARALANPGITAAPGYNSTTPVDEITPWILSLDLDFTMVTAGKRRYQTAQARGLSEAARLDIASTAWRVQGALRRSLVDLYAAQQLAGVRTRQQEILARNIALFERQFAAGAISQFELTQARLMASTSRLALLEAQRQQGEARVALAASMGVTVRALDGITLDFSLFDEVLPLPPGAEARRLALVNRADILGALSQYAASQSALQLEVARQYPDIHLGPGYQMDQDNNKWTLGFSGVLPVLNRNRGPIAEAEARRAAAAANFALVQGRAIEQVDGALAAYASAQAQAATADTMYADQLRLERTADTQFAAGDISRLELGSIQLELASAEMARLDARVNLQRARGRLEEAMQSPASLADWLSIGPSRTPPAVKH